MFQAGFNQVLNYEQAFVILVQSLNPSCLSIMGRTLEILAAVTLVDGGVEAILNAFTDAAEELEIKYRFSIILEALKHHNDKDISAAISSIQLLNCLISNHEDFEQRFHLRCELYRTSDMTGEIQFRAIANDIEKILQEERQNDSNETDMISLNHNNNNMNNATNRHSFHFLQAQVSPRKKFLDHFQIFINSKNDDFDELASRFESLRIDFDSIDDCFRLLRNSVMKTSVEGEFLSILQLLLFIRDDQYTKYH